MPIMGLRLATTSDIEAMQSIRRAVTENPLRDPGRATTEKYQAMLGERGRGWVFEDDAGDIVGFGIAERGTHAELLGRHGKYAALWRAQQKDGQARPESGSDRPSRSQPAET